MTTATCDHHSDRDQIRIEGELDQVGCAEVEDSLREAVRASRGHVVVIDLGAVVFITSRGIGLLLQARRQLLELGRALALAHLRPQVRHALDTVGLLDWLPVVVTK